jgi:hypothetical protein
MSSAKHALWLENQISTARRNLSEWPSWMKEAARFEGAEKREARTIVSGRPAPAQRARKVK